MRFKITICNDGDDEVNSKGKKQKHNMRLY